MASPLLPGSIPAIAVGPRQRIHSPQNPWPLFTVSYSRLPPPLGPGLRIYIPKNRVAQLYPQALGSLSVGFYDSQGRVEVSWIRLHSLESQSAIPWRINSRRTEYKTPSPRVPPIFEFVFVAAQACVGQVSCYGRRSVGQSAPEQSTHLGPTTRFAQLSDSRGPGDAGHPPTRGRVRRP
jgi:hypothetical protein